MKILITGVAGFIGSNLAEFLLLQNHKVYGIDNYCTGSKKNIKSFLKRTNFYFFEDDICNFNFSQLSPVDIIFHLASPASPPQYKKCPVETLMVNSLGTKRVLDFMEQTHSKQFVLASTSEVYGNPQKHPQQETYWGNVNPVGERSCYDEGKRFAESITMAYFRLFHLNVRIARIFNTYGPRMEKNDGRVVSNFIVQALEGRPLTIYGNGFQTRSFCFISDMIQALFLLGTTKDIAGEIINIGNPDERSIIEMAHLIKKMTSSSSSLTFFSKDSDDPEKRKPDITKAKTVLGWEPKIPLEEGLRTTIKYFHTIVDRTSQNL